MGFTYCFQIPHGMFAGMDNFKIDLFSVMKKTFSDKKDFIKTIILQSSMSLFSVTTRCMRESIASVSTKENDCF